MYDTCLFDEVGLNKLLECWNDCERPTGQMRCNLLNCVGLHARAVSRPLAEGVSNRLIKRKLRFTVCTYFLPIVL